MSATDQRTLKQAARTADAELIAVCSACLRASCWQGLFYCERYLQAGTVKKTRGELLDLTLEHHSYWKTDVELAA